MNKKIKVIELLNKIANGEKVPDKIKYNSIIYNWDIKGYLHYEDEHYSERAFLEGYRTDMVLNDEVEILENNTEEIEELKRTENVYDMTLECYHDIEKKISNDELADKINEIIRYIKRKDKNND